MGVELLCQGSHNHVRARLVNTVCLYKGEPVFVKESQEHRLQVSYLADDFRVETVDYRTTDFKYMGLTLGYMNHAQEALYLMRSISRGTGSPALNYDCIKVAGQEESTWDASFMHTKEFGDCIKGIYPSFKDIHEKVDNGDFMSGAFHRHFAIRRHKSRLVITRRGTEDVGFIKGSRIITFDKRPHEVIEAATRGTEFNVEAL